MCYGKQSFRIQPIGLCILSFQYFLTSGVLTSAERDQKDLIVVVLQTVFQSLDSQVYEQQVRKGIDDFGRVWSKVVVL